MVRLVKIRNAFRKGWIWEPFPSDLNILSSWTIRFIRLMVLMSRNFTADNLYLHASALTFYVLLSIVPIVAMAFGIAKGFGFEKMLETRLLEVLPGQQEVIANTIVYARNLLEETRGGLLAGIGVAILLWTVIKVLGTIEQSFNDIWKIERSRSMYRKFSDYLSLMFIGPIFVILSSSLNVFITTQLQTMTQQVKFLGYVSPMLLSMMKTVPYILIWILFTILYMFLPNTKVRFFPGLAAGVIAGTSYQVLQWIYITFQIGVAKYNAIYGSFAALPLFLFWLQLSWLVVLVGAEIAYTVQNREMLESSIRYPNVSSSRLELYSLMITRVVADAFVKGSEAPTISAIAVHLGLPRGIVIPLIDHLVMCGILARIMPDNGGDSTYVLGRDPKTLTIAAIVHAMKSIGESSPPIPNDEISETITSAYQTFERLLMETSDQRPIHEIA